MLKSLCIENVALIQKAEIDFSFGLNVLSGETGAGKSVILESVNFVLGARADKTIICQGCDHCSVTAVFDVFGVDDVYAALSEIGVQADDELIIKRTMQSDGRSSIKLNGEPVTAQMLKKVTSLIVDVHGQSDHFLLLKEKNQLDLIDGLGGEKVEKIKAEISSVIKDIADTDDRLEKFGGSDEDRFKRLDYIEYCLKEIEEVDFKENEDEELLSRRKKLQNYEKIAEAVNLCANSLNGDGGATDLIGECVRAVDGISAFGEEYAELAGRLRAVIDELGDVSETLLGSFGEEFDPNELDVLERRIDDINRIKKKYGGSFSSVAETLENFRSEKNLLLDGEYEAKKLIEKRSELIKKLNGVYDKLTAERKIAAEHLSVELSKKLRELAMKSAVFKVKFDKTDEELNKNGNDEITFLFSANAGEDVKPLSKIASGGELSRLMLAIKSVSGAAFGSFTYIFDEIDAGISGNAAFVVAENFAKIAKNRQIIAVSHLPQIVAMSDLSFYIYKEERGGRTNTFVSALKDDEKVSEVVRLIGGKDGDDGASRTHAENLIRDAAVFKKGLNGQV